MVSAGVGSAVTADIGCELLLVAACLGCGHVGSLGYYSPAAQVVGGVSAREYHHHPRSTT
jgi:hypothetical protein